LYPTTEQGLQALVEPPSVGKLASAWREGGYLEKEGFQKIHGTMNMFTFVLAFTVIWILYRMGLMEKQVVRARTWILITGNWNSLLPLRNGFWVP